jgi:hypothetical protein
VAKRKSRGLGSSTKEHAKHALSRAHRAALDAKDSLVGGCGIRLTSLESAIANNASALAQAFDSGGPLAKGAYTRKTVSAADAVKIYDVNDVVKKAVGMFRRDCVIDREALAGRKGRR